ncbi:zinc metallopeptidase [Vampirovibrio chlorellavorus]|uniref:zinc metallopeptidase n=1 Tax=Vampirovibrio chlorellavorus TaxID=758823 RepID=UPI0026EF1CA3|nr:zinc metallopeptidase [Vampirovibrio chlorellavorus]
MFFHDPLYMVIMLVGGALVFLPQLWVKNTVARFSEVRTARGSSGQSVARRILDEHGLRDVPVEMVDGFLSDHYDPGQRVVRLSPEVYQGSSVASVAVAAHECGHAIQHVKGFYPVVVRSSLVPLANLGSQMGPILLMLAVFLGLGSKMGGMGFYVALAGVVLYGLAVAFHFVTLPVELDASGRALKVLQGNYYLNQDELSGAKKVLTAAAFTYVATALYALMELLYWVFRLLGSRRD